MCLSTGTPKNINFSFETNGKLMALGVPILKHFRVFHEIPIFQTVISKVIISLSETVRLSISILLRNLYNSSKNIKENNALN